MYEGSMMLICGLIIEAIALFVSIHILVVCKKRNFEFQNTEELPKLTKRLSIIPLTVNFIILIVFVSSVIASNISLNLFVALGILFSLILSAFSATIGPATGLLGIIFSVVYTKKQTKRRKGIAYIIISCLSLLISLGILCIYIQALTPIAVSYFDLS